MFITGGDVVKVRATVSGPIGDFMPAEVVMVSNTAGPMLIWSPAGNSNRLFDFVAGEIYNVLVNADVNIPVFVSTTDFSQANDRRLSFLGESLDVAFGSLAPIPLVNDTTTLLRITAVGRDGYAYHAVIEKSFLISCSGSGVVVIEYIALGSVYGDADLDVDTASNQVTPKVQNTTAAFVGATRWAVAIEFLQILYPPST